MSCGRLPFARSKCALLAASLVTVLTSAQAQGPQELPPVTVVGTVPLVGHDLPADQIPGSAYVVDAEQIRRDRPLTIADQINRGVASVFVNAAQGNPYQPDITFRGFAASPLLGTPIGMSVFVDGVRVNEPFGDTVLWDLIPTAAIGSLALLPGANPAFGLNTLGGALVVQTKRCRTHGGVEAEIGAGSFGRRAAQTSIGGRAGSFDALLAAQYQEEDGWRDKSPSRVRQLFGQTGWQAGNTAIDAIYTFADNVLIGNGLAPESLLASRRESVYTYPDETKPRLHFVNLQLRHALGGDALFSGNVYHRRLSLRTFNGDAEYDDGGTPLDPTDDEYEAENRRTATRQWASGATAQLAWTVGSAAVTHRLTVGVSRDRGRAEFSQYEQPANFTADRGTSPDGDFELDVRVRGYNVYDGIYLTDTISFGARTHLSLAGRYNRAKVEIRDLTGLEPALNGTHRFSRFTPSAGITFAPVPAATLYARYSEGYRVPTPVELTCADPAAPCSLPVAFVADPPLRPVVAKSWETGVRSARGESLNWSVGAFRTDLRDDILFTAVGAGQGFFANVPKTRRQGVELGLSGRAKSLGWGLAYAYVDATFESPVALFNPVAVDADPSQPATIDVRAGDRVPGIPRHRLKANAEWRIGSVVLGAETHSASSQFLRGDESNEQRPLSGYTIANLRASVELGAQWNVSARVNNVFDRKYETLGALNRNAFDANSQPLDGVGPGPVERFVAPGAPRSFWIDVQYRFN